MHAAALASRNPLSLLAHPGPARVLSASRARTHGEHGPLGLARRKRERTAVERGRKGRTDGRGGLSRRTRSETDGRGEGSASLRRGFGSPESSRYGPQRRRASSSSLGLDVVAALDILGLEVTCAHSLAPSVSLSLSPLKEAHRVGRNEAKRETDARSQSRRLSHSALERSSSGSMGASRGESMSASKLCLARPREASRPAKVA